MSDDESTTKSVGEAIRDLKALGPAKNRPRATGRCLAFADSDVEYETAIQGFCALCQRYMIPSHDMLLLREALVWIINYGLSRAGESLDADLSWPCVDDIKWQ